jgi:hypothetical protein
MAVTQGRLADLEPRAEIPGLLRAPLGPRATPTEVGRQRRSGSTLTLIIVLAAFDLAALAAIAFGLVRLAGWA